MKLILLAAAAAIAMPALAQTSGSTGTSSPTSNGGKGTANDSAVGTMSTDPSTTTPAPQDSMSQQMPPSAPMPAQTTATGDPVGGYQPAAPAMNGPMQPGATVTYQQAPSPDQAYPAPAPLAKYPMCKPGQFDKCMQGKGSTHSRQVHRRK